MNKIWVFLILALNIACGPGSGNATYQSLSDTDQVKFEKYIILGKDIYITNCNNCHQPNGKGLHGIIPPLANSDYLESSQLEIPCLLKHGSKDSITVNGLAYPPQMPAHNLSNLELAEVITYINNSWGNEFGFTPVITIDKMLRDCQTLNK